MKKVAVINDLSGFGRCSLTAALPVLAAMGTQPVPLPTAMLSAQTGYPDYTYLDLTGQMHGIRRAWQSMGVRFDGISTGFVANPAQFNQLNAFLDTFQREDTLVMVDPVMGDGGHAFGMFSPALLEGMRGLCYRGTLLVPNLTECCLLTNWDYSALTAHKGEQDYTERVSACGEALRRPGQTVVITGVQVPGEDGSPTVGNLALWAGGTFFLAQPYNGKSYSGTGDLFAAALLGALLRGETVPQAVERAERFLSAAIAAAAREGTDRNDGVPYEAFLGMLLPF
ncbi:MAG: bifunctional hydroxymethylpyrimidine kinase/phosphomethylpyrimidine kinase [Clostridiales bacterium]|nr:bifunctional hydroxymethylpyrimidine kinase/phosphomethylpyrimidine kinase [Clostridiales bacterium]